MRILIFDSKWKLSDLSELIGVIIGDGCLSNKSGSGKIEICFNPKEKDFVNYVEYILKNITEKNPSKIISKKAIRLVVYKNDFFNFLTQEVNLPHGKIKGKIVMIPEYITSLKWIYLKNTIRGIFDTDGSIFISRKPGISEYPSIEITTISKNLAFQLFNILNKYGFRTTIRNYKPKIGERTYKIGLYGYAMVNKWFREIGSSNKTKNQKFHKIIKMGQERFELSTIRDKGFHPPSPRSSAV